MKRSLRILMVTTSFPRWAGDYAGHFVAALAEEIASLGHAVTVLAPHEAGTPVNERVGRVNVRRFRYLPERLERVAYGSGIVFNLKHDPRAAMGVVPFALAIRHAVHDLARDADLVHIHWAPTATLSAPWSTGVPTVLTVHGSDVTLAQSRGPWRMALTRALRSVDGLNVVSRDQQAYLVGTGLWDTRPLAVVPAGISAELPNLPREPGTHERFHFLFVGRLVRSKGVIELADALGDMIEAGMDVELDFVGTGTDESLLRERVAARGIQHRVAFRGVLAHGDTLNAIAKADALVLPSYGEGSPLVVAEALALGTPVVGSRVGAIPDLLGEEGLVVNPRDRIALANAMRRLAEDSELAVQLSRQGRDRARRDLIWPAIAQKTIELYRETLESRLGHA